MENTGKTCAWFIFIFLLFSASVYSQKGVGGVEDILEQLTANGEEEINWANEIEELTERIQEPKNLNGITKEELEYYSFLSDKQIENILAYLYIHGQMQTIYELQLVDEMDYEAIQRLIPFVYVQPVQEEMKYPSLKNVLKYGKHEWLTRFDIPFYTRKAYKETDKVQNRYWGPREYHSLRYSFKYKDNLYTGITAEKDAGEPFFGMHNKKGYDYYSFYFYLRDIGKLKNLAIGNYRLSFGQGLVISQDFMLGKSTTMSTLSTRKNSIKKHSSTDEYNYLRGLAGTYRVGDFDISAFYSHRSMDGIINGDTITSIQKTGLHRTTREAERKNALTMQLAGGNITYNGKFLRLGVTGVYYFFDRYYQPQIREYSKYNLYGNHFYNLGMDYRLRWKRLTFAGEFAMDKNQNVAMVNSVNYTFKSDYKFMLIHRLYPHDYWSFYGRSFSESGYVQNENGWYLATEISSVANWRFFASVDLFSFPWWKYRIDRPSNGQEATLQATYSPNRKISMYLRYRYKKKDRNYTDEDKVKTVRPLYHHRLRYQLKWDVTNQLFLRTTLDYNRINPDRVEASQGFQVVQSISYQVPFIPLQTELHGSYFQTDDYDSRVYSYEKGLLYSFYSPSFYGKGSRFAVHLRWDINKQLMVIGKLAQTRYYDRNEIGSGWDMFEGKHKTDLQLQLRLKL